MLIWDEFSYGQSTSRKKTIAAVAACRPASCLPSRVACLHQQRYSTSKALAIGVAAIFAAAGMAFLASPGPSETERTIAAKLAELRGRGVPLTPAEIARVLPDPDPDHDAKILLAKALELAKPNTDSAADLPLLGDGQLPKRGESIPDPVMNAMRLHLAEGAVMNAVPECLDGVRFSMKWNSGSTNPPLHPKFIEIRNLIQTLMLQAIYEAENSNSTRACEALRKGFAVAWTMNDDDLYLTMMRTGSAGAMCIATEQVLNRIQLTATELTELEHQIVPERIGDFRNAFMGERVVRLKWFDEERKQYGQRDLKARFKEIAQVLSRRSQPKYRDEDRLLFLKSMEARERALSLPVVSCLHTNSSIENEYWQKVKSVAGGENGGLLCSSALKTAFETRARLTALISVLATERYRLSHSGALPSGLADLVLDSLPALPMDPFDDQPLRYEKRDAGYVIYSIGADGRDDGGKEPAHPPESQGYDVTVIVER
jgi:hypothetical protein